MWTAPSSSRKVCAPALQSLEMMSLSGELTKLTAERLRDRRRYCPGSSLHVPIAASNEIAISTD